jgi:hypothetical protein
MFTSTIDTYSSAVIDTRFMLAASLGRPCGPGWFHDAGVMLADAKVLLAGRWVR